MEEHKAKILEVCNEIRKNTLMETLEIEYVDVGENFLLAATAHGFEFVAARRRFDGVD